MVTRKEYEVATAEGSRMLATTPHALAARYDQHADRIVITASSHCRQWVRLEQDEAQVGIRTGRGSDDGRGGFFGERHSGVAQPDREAQHGDRDQGGETRPSEGKIELEQSPFDLRDLVVAQRAA